MRWLIGVLGILAISAGALAQDTSALIGQAMDRQIKLQVNAILPEAMRLIGQQTGVRIEAESIVWDLLPWGDQTNLSAKIENQTLREALNGMTRKLGLTYVLKDEAIELHPMPALRRLGRRSTLQELQALDYLAATPFHPEKLEADVPSLIAAIDAVLLETKSAYAVENRAQLSVPNQLIEIPRNATLIDALELIDGQTPATWFPWGKSIVLMNKETLVRTQLNKKISARYAGVDLAQVLLELSQRAGLTFTIDPGALQQVPAEFRTIKLSLDNATIQQALESISGFTGLTFTTNDKGVYCSRQPAAGTSADPIIAIIPLDNGVQGVITQSQLSPAQRTEIQSKLRQAIEGMKK